MAFDGSYVFQCRLCRLAERNGFAGIFIPNRWQIDNLWFARERIHISFCWLYTKVAHAKEHSIFFDEQAAVCLSAQRFFVYPSVFEQHIDHT